MSSTIRGFPSPRHDHSTFEERRAERVEGFKSQAIRDNLPFPSVSYYRTIDEQNQFLHSIENTQFGKSLIEIQYRFNKEMGIALILPKFNNLENISVQEQQFLASQGISIGKDRQGNYGAGLGGTNRGRPGTGVQQNYEDIALTSGQRGAFYQFIEPSDYYISIGVAPPTPSLLKLWEKQPDGSYIKIKDIGKQKKPESVFQPAITEPAAVTITESLLPEISILPQAHAEPEPVVDVWPTLSQETQKIIDNFPNAIKKSQFQNNIDWLLQGLIDEATFLRAYYYLIEQGAITFPEEPEPIVDQVSTNMIRQELLNFTIVNNRIQGSIKFTATDAFNPYYYNKPITTYLQLKSADLPNWTHISTTNPKSNRLTFTETQRDEVITFDEDAQNLTFVSAKSFIVPAMSDVFAFTIEAGKEPTVAGKTGLMGAGVLGIIGILMLGGFIADHVRRKR